MKAAARGSLSPPMPRHTSADGPTPRTLLKTTLNELEGRCTQHQYVSSQGKPELLLSCRVITLAHYIYFRSCRISRARRVLLVDDPMMAETRVLENESALWSTSQWMASEGLATKSLAGFA